MGWREWDEERRDRLAWAGLAGAMAIAALLLLWEGRGQTLFVDEWSFGYLGREGLSLSALLAPDNGHLAAVPVLITKASLELFGAATALPLRVVAVATHLAVALMLFVMLRRSLGALAALLPAVLLLFLGSAADIFIGSHALPIELSAATGLAAWLALRARTTAWDAAATALLVVGIASNGFALPFIAGAAAIVWLDSRSSWRRQWIVALPLLLYALWRLTEGSGEESDFAIVNLAGLPAFAFDSLAAELASITGLFAEAGGTENVFQLGPGQALAGASLVALAIAAVGWGYRPPRAAIPALVALLTLWLTTGMVASPARQPEVARYIYTGVVLLLLVAGQAIAAIPAARRGAVALGCVCAIGLIPNVQAIRDAGIFFREQSDQNRAALAAADLLPARVPDDFALETESDQPEGGYADLSYLLGSYREAKMNFGTPAFTLEELRRASATSREGADLLIARALPIELRAAASAPRPFPAGTRVGQEGGRLRWRRGCVDFVPLTASAQLILPVPPGGIWIRPDTGPSVPVGLRRFGDGYAVGAEAPAGQASEIPLLPSPAGRDWEAQLRPRQPLLVCAASERRSGGGPAK
ncbi:MAG TPA: hypothetical protein VN756_02870 [Solirubrobacterales bacterium]|nr:hypothetical protein [Solirubrobacterales bacterium]